MSNRPYIYLHLTSRVIANDRVQEITLHDGDETHRSVGDRHTAAGNLLAKWISQQYQDRLIALSHDPLAGIIYLPQLKYVIINGLISIPQILSVACRIGLRITPTSLHKPSIDGFMVVDTLYDVYRS